MIISRLGDLLYAIGYHLLIGGLLCFPQSALECAQLGPVGSGNAVNRDCTEGVSGPGRAAVQTERCSFSRITAGKIG